MSDGIMDMFVVKIESFWWPDTQCGYHLPKTVQSGGAQAISQIIYIDDGIVCCIETYLIPI